MNADTTIDFDHLREALTAAEERAERAKESAEACDDLDCDEPTEHVVDHWIAADEAADAAREALAIALRGSDEDRTWDVYEEGYLYDTFEGTLEEALAFAKDNVDRANYSDAEGTIYIDVEVSCEQTGEHATATVTLEEDEPPCAHGHEHDWQSPFELLGGLEENPGVWGHGGGVIIREVCMICGCGRTTDTWATNPNTGEQGLREVSYSPGEYTNEVRWPHCTPTM